MTSIRIVYQYSLHTILSDQNLAIYLGNVQGKTLAGNRIIMTSQLIGKIIYMYVISQHLQINEN